MAYIGKTPVIGNFQKCDSISVVNGQAAYTLQVGGANVSPQSENHMLVSLNGILQAPVDSFTVSGSTLTFASNLITGDVIDFVMILGNVLDLGVPSDNTVSTAKIVDANVTAAKMFSGFANGITEADMWRMTANLTVTGTSSTAITTNLERSDTYGSGYLGTGMTQSGGVFTFPETGIYQLTAIGSFYGGLDMTYCRINIEVTTDSGSNYNTATTTNNHTHNGFYGMSYNECFFDVTNTSSHKIKFVAVHQNSGALQGDTNENFTFFKFIRLGDT